jgi:hypothetical protein
VIPDTAIESVKKNTVALKGKFGHLAEVYIMLISPLGPLATPSK